MGVWTSFRHKLRGWLLRGWHNPTKQRESRHGELFFSARESSRQQMESQWGRASPWENDSDWLPPLPGSLLRTHKLAAASATAFRAAVLAGPTFPGTPGETFVPACLCSAVPLLPTVALLLLPSLWDHPWPLLFCGHLANPSEPLLIYPYHHSLIFSAESGMCICCMRGSIYKQYSGHCNYFLFFSFIKNTPWNPPSLITISQ